MAENPLKYRELIEPDDSIENAIKQLTQLGETYDKMIGKVRTEATALETSVKGLSGATDEHREKIKNTYREVDKLTKAQNDLTQAQSTQAQQLASLKALQQEQNAVNKLTAQYNNNVEGSYNRLSAEYALNKVKINQMSQAWREQTEEGKRFVAGTNEIYQKMIQMQEITGKHTLSVGNYSKANAGLGRSISMMASELPNAAQSMRIFIMSLSNNWMQLGDSIKATNLEQKDLMKQFKAGLIDTKPDSTIKQIMKSMVSFNVILMVGVTLFSLYGEKAINWIASLFKSTDAIEQNKAALKRLNEIKLEQNKSAAVELVRAKLLYDASQDTTRSLGERKKAVDELQKQFPAYFKNIDDEQILAGKAAGKYRELAGAILASAKARAAEEMIVENQKKILELESKKADALRNKTLSENQLTKDKKDSERSTKGAGLNPSEQIIGLAIGTKKSIEDIKSYGNEAQTAQKQIDLLSKANDKLVKSVNINDLLVDPGKPKKDPAEKKTTIYHDADVKEFEWKQAMEESLTKTMIAGRTQDVESLNLSIDKKKEKVDKYIEELQKQQKKIQETLDQTKDPKQKKQAQKDYDKVTGKLTDSLGLQTGLDAQYEEERKKGIQDIDDKYALIAIDKKKTELETLLSLTETGTEEENKIKLQILENGRKEALLKNRQGTIETRQDEKLINSKYDRLILEQSTKFDTEKSMLLFDAQQRDEKTEFDRLNHTEKEKTRFRLQAEKDRLEKILSLNEMAGAKLSNKEVSQIKDTIAKINGEMKANDGKKGKTDIYSLIGLDLDDDKKSAINESTSYALGKLDEILQANVTLAEKAVEASQKEVDAKKTNLDNEIEARNNGYASNVSGATKEYEASKKTLEKAQKDKEKAAKQQAQLETVMQTGSLITASANIWSSLSAIPVIGVGLALAALGVMWGSFAASKVKAGQVAKASYGEGGFEFLDGGSHQGGNDVPIGKTPDGRDRRAEGGEMLAVIRKTSTRRYRHILPDIIDSLNHGVFESKYLNAYGTGGMSININSPGTNVKELERDVSEIRRQGERKYFTDGKGQIIEIYKNLKRTHK
jgi:hypothetical protein